MTAMAKRADTKFAAALAGAVPAIPVFPGAMNEGVDGRDQPGHDELPVGARIL
jgi:hypothetical protein